MHTLQSQTPCSQLRPFVRAYAQREIGVDEPDVLTPIPARLEQTLEFQLGSAFTVTAPDGSGFTTPEVAVVGYVLRGGSSIVLRRGVKSFAVFFQPTGFSDLFCTPVAELSGTFFDAQGLMGPQVTNLRNRLLTESTFLGRVRLTEDFLLVRAARAAAKNPIIAAANDIFASRGVVRITDIAGRYAQSERHFERQFSSKIGIPPKLFARIARFQSALDMKIAFPSRTWLEIAHHFCYHDQMHLVHDFRSLAGDAPGRTFSVIGDARPHAALD